MYLAISDVDQYLDCSGRGIEVVDRHKFRMSYRVVSGVAIIEVNGVIWGKEHIDVLTEQFEDAMSDEKVHSVLWDFDSPGGQIKGVELLHRCIFDRRGQKPVHALVNTICSSCAYFVATACDSIIALGKNARVGSIGILFEHQDITARQEKLGIKVTPLSTRSGKIINNSSIPLDKEREEKILAQLKEYESVFIELVAQGRNTTIQTVDGWATGESFIADKAKAMRMIDGVIGKYEQAIEALAINNQINVLKGVDMSVDTELQKNFQQEVEAKVQEILPSAVEKQYGEQLQKMKAENELLEKASAKAADDAVVGERDRTAKIMGLDVAEEVKAKAIREGTSFADVCIDIATNHVSKTPSGIDSGQVVGSVQGVDNGVAGNSAGGSMLERMKARNK